MSQEEILIYERDDTEFLYYTWHFTIADAITHYDLLRRKEFASQNLPEWEELTHEQQKLYIEELTEQVDEYLHDIPNWKCATLGIYKMLENMEKGE